MLVSQKNEHGKNIEFSTDKIQSLLKSLGVVWYKYDTSKISYSTSVPKAWYYSPTKDEIWIHPSFSLNMKVHVHELLHAFSGILRYQENHNWLSLSGFHLHKIWSLKWQFFSFNEWVTQLLTHEILSNKQKEISQIYDSQSKYRRRLKALLVYKQEEMGETHQTIKETISAIDSPLSKTWWYMSYEQEMNLVNIIIDLLTYTHIWKQDISFKEVREKNWTNFQFHYFTGNIKWLKSTIKTLDPSWLLYQHLMDLKPKEWWVEVIYSGIKEHILDVFDKCYIERKVADIL